MEGVVVKAPAFVWGSSLQVIMSLLKINSKLNLQRETTHEQTIRGTTTRGTIRGYHQPRCDINLSQKRKYNFEILLLNLKDD